MALISSEQPGVVATLNDRPVYSHGTHLHLMESSHILPNAPRPVPMEVVGWYRSNRKGTSLGFVLVHHPEHYKSAATIARSGFAFSPIHPAAVPLAYRMAPYPASAEQLDVIRHTILSDFLLYPVGREVGLTNGTWAEVRGFWYYLLPDGLNRLVGYIHGLVVNYRDLNRLAIIDPSHSGHLHAE